MKSISPNYVKTFVLCALFSYGSIFVSAQVGTGFSEPIAILQIMDEYSSTGSTRTLLFENFESFALGRYEPQVGAGVEHPCTNNGWQIYTTPTKVTSDFGGEEQDNKMLVFNTNDEDCHQNAIADLPFALTPTTASISISLNCKLLGPGPDNGSLRVVLWDVGSNAEKAEVFNIEGKNETEYYSVSTKLAIGGNYSLRLIFEGNHYGGVLVDNISVTERVAYIAPSHSSKKDNPGSQPEYILTSNNSTDASQTASNTPSVLSYTSGLELMASDDPQAENLDSLVQNLQQGIRDRKVIIQEGEKKIEALKAELTRLKSREK